MEYKDKIMLSGVKPSGCPHIGNYFGAMKQFVELQNSFKQSFIFIADLHALTTTQNKEEMEQNIIDIALDYLAIGLNPKKVTIFKQSDVPQVTELAWTFNCITTMPFLMRAHAFKDAEAKNKEINVGVFDYPILMAADILIQDSDIVPVGKDQKQHVEIARDIALKFNQTFGDVFKLPEPLILKNVETVPGTDGQKMSKSYGNTIGLFAEREEIQKAVMSIPTDSKPVEESKDPDKSLLFAIHKLFLNDEEIKKLRFKYQNGGVGYKELKDELINDIDDFIKPLREKRAELSKNKNAVKKILKRGGKVAYKNAEKKMEIIRSKTGFKLD